MDKILLGDLQEELKQALLAHDGLKVSTLRLLLSEIHNLEIQKGLRVSEADIAQVISREVKKRKEAAAGFRSGGREEAAKKEELELLILEKYLPTQLSDEELTKLIESSINELGANSIQDMGKVIGVVMGKAKGQADGARVSEITKKKLLG